MPASGLGQDGYVRIQKEVTYNTPVTNSMTFLPVKAGSTFMSSDQEIANANVIVSRLKQTPNIGRRVCTFSMKMDVHFTLIGLINNLLLGTSTDSGTGAITHTWLAPSSGLQVGKSFTMEICKGGDTAEQWSGCVITSMTLTTDNSGQIELTLNGVGCSYTENVSRASSATYPTQLPGNFSNIVLNVDPDNAVAFDQPANSIEYSIDLGYDLENFKTGSRFINQPVFNTIPSIMLKANIDADRQFPVAAHAFTYYKNLLTITSTENANGSTKFSWVIELPKGKLNAETMIPFENDRLTMDLEWDMSYGGTTTGSSSALVMGEHRIVDATASYA